MKIVLSLAAVAGLTLSPAMALATTPKPPAPQTVQAQIDDLRQQVAALQQQVQHLKSNRTQQVCISLWCA
jgi:hypothetical protein